jgi:PAS domain S-box-containing protein
VQFYDVCNLLGHIYIVFGYFNLLKSIYISTAEEPFFREIQVKHKLNIKEKEMAAIVESSADGIIGITLDGFITSWNLGAEMIYGYRADEAIGMHVSMLAPGRMYEQELLKMVASMERVVNFETTRQRKDGSLIHVSITVSPIVDNNGFLSGISAIARELRNAKRWKRSSDWTSNVWKPLLP